MDCLRVSLGVKRHCDHDNPLKGKYLIGAGLQVHYHHGRKHGGMYSDIVLEREVAESSTWQAAGRDGDTGPGLGF